MDKPMAAECYPAGDYLREELSVRKWTVADLFRGTGIEVPRLEEILNGGRVSMRESVMIGGALGVHPELILRLQLGYLKWLRANEEKTHGHPGNP